MEERGTERYRVGRLRATGGGRRAAWPLLAALAVLLAIVAAAPASAAPFGAASWGYNEFGQLGSGSTAISRVPVAVSGLGGVTAVSAGGEHSLALLSNGTVMAWGDNREGQLGNGSTAASHESRSRPARNTAWPCWPTAG